MMSDENPKGYDVIVIGGGQAGLVTGRFLENNDLNYVILDNHDKPGGAWQQTWYSLHLFSPAFWSSLPGVIMTGGKDYYPTRDETIDYLAKYEKRYHLNIQRPIKVEIVHHDHTGFSVLTDNGPYYSKTVVSATGTWSNPMIPDYPGRDRFRGNQLHSAHYKKPDTFKDQTVLIVGEGNSGAQILSEVSRVADTIWVTKNEPDFLPDNIDGHDLFQRATQLYKARKEGRKNVKAPSPGDIVMVPPVIDARKRGVLQPHPPFDHFEEHGVHWSDGTFREIETVIWCTGFKPALQHLKALDIYDDKGHVPTNGTQSLRVPGLWLVGYGNWTGFASATLIGVGRTARQTVGEIRTYLKEKD